MAYRPREHLEYPELTMYQMVRRIAEQYPKEPAYEFYNHKTSYGTFLKKIDRAARAFALDCVEGRADPNHLTEDGFGKYLYSAGVPDPDLIIRPSGEVRLSNFLPWQSAYAEFYFTDVLWPDFSKEELLRAIAVYQHRSRRYGGV